MKKAFILLLICASVRAEGQLSSVTEITGRIHLQEKVNQPLRALPQMLLTAFCQGKIKAYYPQAPEVEMSFANFIAYFDIPIENPANNSHTCVCETCKNLDPSYIEAFSRYMDYTEAESLDAITSRYKYDTRYIRIMLAGSYTMGGQEFAGPVFHYSDIEKLFPGNIIFNTQNDAALLTLHQVFSEHLFVPELRPGKDMFNKLRSEELAPEMEQEEQWQE